MHTRNIAARGARSLVLSAVALLIAVPAFAGVSGSIFDVNVSFGDWNWRGLDRNLAFGFRDAGFNPIGGSDDAFDDYGDLLVDGAKYNVGTGTIVGNISGTATTDIAIIGDVLEMGDNSDIDVFASWYLYVDRPLARQTLTLTNTATVPRSVDVLRQGDLGSDDDTTVRATSTGNVASAIQDVVWAVTSDDGEGDVVLLQLLGKTAQQLAADGIIYTVDAFGDGASSDDIDQFYTLTLQPGETVTFAWFVQMFNWDGQAEFDAAVISAAAAGFTSLSGDLLAGLDTDLIATIVNWGDGSQPAPSSTPPPTLACTPTPAAAGQTVTCTITGGPGGGEILWRAAYNPPFAGAGVTLDAGGTGTFSFTVPAAALGQELTVELVEWLAPASLGAVGGPVPGSVPAGEGPTVPVGLLALALLAAAGAVVAARRQVVTG